MSETTQPDSLDEAIQSNITFLERYYKDDIAELVEHYPRERRSLWIDYDDLYQFEPGTANDLQNYPHEVLPELEEALYQIDLPVDIDLSRAYVRVYNFPQSDILGVGKIRSQHTHKYVGVKGHISRVTPCRPKIEEAAFKCKQCEMITHVPQANDSYQEPHECESCERQGPFELDYKESTFTDRRKVQLKQPPEDTERGEGDTITVYLEDDLADPPEETLNSRVGEDAIFYGIVELDQHGGRNNKQPVFDPYIDGKAFEFERDTEHIDIDAHKDEFMNAADSPNAYQKFIDSMAPDIYPYGRWPLALQLGAAYLFGGVRVAPEDGSTYRGDIHMAVIGPPGVGKSKFSQRIAELSPGCEHRSATGLSSDVGLTAAAVQDDFADGDWVLKPGILPRSKHHAILDEADKANADLSKMNDALEGEQMASIDKGGISAKLKTRVGLMVMGNPESGRWDENLGVKEQVSIDESLWSRFDGIVLLEDSPEESQDEELADHVIENYRVNLKRQESETDPEDIARPVSWDAMKAWVKYARENITPELSDRAVELLTDYYVEIRNDDDFAENSHPTARKLEAGIRFATAFARLRLSDTVEKCDVDMAVDLSKSLLGQTLNGGELDGDVFTEAEEKSQANRRERIQECIMDEHMTPLEIAKETDIDIESVKADLEKWYRRTNPAPVTRDQEGAYKWIA